MKDQPGGGARRVKEPEWEMRRTGQGGGADRVKNQSEKCEGPGRGGDQRLFEKKGFLKNQKMNQTLLK